MTFDPKPIFDAARTIKADKLTQADVDLMNAAINTARFGPSAPSLVRPPWVDAAMADLGLKEITGPATAPRIAKMLSLLGYPFSDDETPWCGTAMAAWFKSVGIEPPKAGYRALNWATWGVPCKEQIGAVGVKSRAGGNHVFQLVGQAGEYFKCLGANQGNMVSIVDIAKADVFAIRWPFGVPQRNMPLPEMARGTVSRNEG